MQCNNLTLRILYVFNKLLNINKKKPNLILDQKELSITKNLNWNNKNIYIKNDIKICLKNSAILSINNSELFDSGKNKISFIACNEDSGSVIISNSYVNLHDIEIVGLRAPQKSPRAPKRYQNHIWIENVDCLKMVRPL